MNRALSQLWQDDSAAGMTSDAQADFLARLTAESMDGACVAPSDRALVEYADKLTRTPGAVTSADVAQLRTAGFDDRAIHDACAIVAHFAFVNRIADGLGVELEDHSKP
jgi:uncharacterized peroxidase-related enzyme